MEILYVFKNAKILYQYQWIYRLNNSYTVNQHAFVQAYFNIFHMLYIRMSLFRL